LRILEPTEAHILEAADALKRGELVGMPTETVYGLAANAFDEAAVRRIYEIKGRPTDNPLIVHLGGIEHVRRVASEWPDNAAALAERFWPGPLTIVVPKRPELPEVVTGGLDTVAIRVPIHPVAQLLLLAAELPLSAPSANLFMALSPTRAHHIDPSIANALFCILDGGPSEYGIESTVVDCSGAEARLLRPGGISRAQIERLIGPLAAASKSGPKRSPGQYRRHYAPRTKLRIVESLFADEPGISLSEPLNDNQIRLPSEPARYAAKLFATLRKLDGRSLPVILIQAPPDTPEWEAVWDRLRKAAGTEE
jgi:L-threonylcarbamoyladenylate synthase